MKTVILDTNFLLIPFTKKVDIFTELDILMHEKYEIAIIEGTIDELNKIIDEQRGKHKNAAKMALQLIERKNIAKFNYKKQKSLNSTINSVVSVVDDIIVDISDKQIYVATQDKNLKTRLINKGVRVIFLRNKKLEIQDVL